MKSDVSVDVWDDPLSDRIRCDHPPADLGEGLVAALIAEARRSGRGRVVVLIPVSQAALFEAHRFQREALVPGFYAGAEDCAIYAWAERAEQLSEQTPEGNAKAMAVWQRCAAVPSRPRVGTQRATDADAEAIAGLLGRAFKRYPTPSCDASYVRGQLAGGMPFRLIYDGNELVACASADRTPHARTAELTDCATLPTHRRRGFMVSLLQGLMDDLGEMNYVSAYTMARASSVGMNLAFHRTGFGYRGRMTKSCYIGEGLEDMNVWSRDLPAMSNDPT